jgi:hypothetical protein
MTGEARATRDWEIHRTTTSLTGTLPRIDIKRYWNIKVEGHFMDGYGSPDSVHGFYEPQNPFGFQRSTHMLVIRTGFNL